MSKKKTEKNHHKDSKNKQSAIQHENPDIFKMSYSPKLNEGYHWFQDLPIMFYIGVIFTIVRMKSYASPLEAYWTTSKDGYADFFSYFKASYIIIIGVLALLILLYRVFTQSLLIKKTKLYIPLGIYTFFVILSWIFSDYGHFAYKGYNDRFEGSIVILSYVLMMFYIINTVNTEKTVKRIFTTLGITSFFISLLGMSQYLGHDFFRTTFGKKLITPKYYWPNVDSLKFTFQNNEIYQTVYNINYVSFYLALLIPIFSMLFFRAKDLKIKISLGVLTGLLVFNLIGSKSTGGMLGIGIAFIIGVILLNKKLLEWWRSVAIILGVAAIIVVLTANTLLPELLGTIKKSTAPAQAPSVEKTYIDYLDTEGTSIFTSLNSKPVEFRFDFNQKPPSMILYDNNGESLPAKVGENSLYSIDSEGYDEFSFKLANSEDVFYLQLLIDETSWNFALLENEVLYRNVFGKYVDLDKVETMGFKGRENFGNGRGYIWSRSLPVMMDHFFIGSGADTFIFEFPHKDYYGKYNTDWKLNLVVDKPHSMYIQYGVNTGVLSLLSLLALFGMYLVWSFRLYFKNNYETFYDFIGAGIFLGVCGFLVAGIANDTTVSVMPMFYGIFAVGIAVNMKVAEKKNCLKSI